MAYQLFGLKPPGEGLDPSSMFSGMLLGRMSTANGADTDHFRGLLMLALQTLDTLACRARAHHSDVSERLSAFHPCRCIHMRVYCVYQAVSLVSWTLSVVTTQPIPPALVMQLLEQLADTHRVS